MILFRSNAWIDREPVRRLVVYSSLAGPADGGDEEAAALAWRTEAMRWRASIEDPA